MTRLDVDFTGNDEIKSLVQRVNKNLSGRTILTGIGLRVLRFIHQNFRAGGIEKTWKPLQPNTQAARRGSGGGGQILRDTGRLEQSYGSAVAGHSVDVGTNMKIAPFHEFGTRPYTIRPKNSGGKLRFMTAGGFAFANVVRHPGLPKRQMLPSQKKGEELAVSILTAAAEKLDGRN